jgi:hypothetical protein
MQRTLVLTGLAMVLAATAGLAVVMEKRSNGSKLGALWSGTARRLKAVIGRP